MHIEFSMFIISRINGEVAFYSLSTFKRLSVLNDSSWNVDMQFRFSKINSIGRHLIHKFSGNNANSDKYKTSLTIDCLKNQISDSDDSDPKYNE